MKKSKTPWDMAVYDFSTYYGRCPTIREFENLYYEYGKNWKQYKSFAEWLAYYVA
jgi:hypothetical protein